MPPATLISSFQSLGLNPYNHLYPNRALTWIGSVLSIPKWTLLCPSISVSFHQLLTHSVLQEERINLLTSVCIHPTKAPPCSQVCQLLTVPCSSSLWGVSLCWWLSLLVFPCLSEATCLVLLHQKPHAIWRKCDGQSVATSERPSKQFLDKWLGPEHLWLIISHSCNPVRAHAGWATTTISSGSSVSVMLACTWATSCFTDMVLILNDTHGSHLMCCGSPKMNMHVICWSSTS